MGWTLCAAALTGGAHQLWGQGRIFAASCALVFGLAGGAAASQSEPSSELTLPSGQNVLLLEQRDEPETQTVRLRYIAPDLASPMTRPSFEDLTADLEFLCAEFARTVIQSSMEAPAQIVVSLSAEEVEFGVTNTEVEQVFEAFRLENGACILEVF